MGKSSPSPPPAPDYAGAAYNQGVANVEAARVGARLSNPNVIGPTGSQTVTFEGDTPTITQTLAPDALQALRNQQEVQAGLSGLAVGATNTAQGALARPFNPTGPSLQTSLGGFGAVPNAPNLGLYGQAQGGLAAPTLQGYDPSGVPNAPVSPGTTGQEAILSRLRPEMAQQEAATRNRLANQGLASGGEAYTNEMRDLTNRQNDQYTQAALQGIGLDTAAQQNAFSQAMSRAQFGQGTQAQQFGLGVQSQGLQNQALQQNQNTALAQLQAQNSQQANQFNQAQQMAQFGNQAQQQSLAQQLALRNQPLNEISGLMSGSQIMMPQFQGYSGSQVAPAPVFNAAQAAGAAATQNYGIAQSGVNAQTSGMYDLLGAGVRLSDRRLKSNIVRVGDHPLGVGVYEYDIAGRRERGVMAQEVLAVKPSAVHVHPSGYYMVDYGVL